MRGMPNSGPMFPGGGPIGNQYIRFPSGMVPSGSGNPFDSFRGATGEFGRGFPMAGGPHPGSLPIMGAPGSFGRPTVPESTMMMMSMDPGNSAYLSQINTQAEYLAGSGDFMSAIKYYELSTEMDPGNGFTWTSLGHCYLLNDELQKAFSAYQKALYSLPDVKDPQLWYGIGLLYDKFNTLEYAIPTLLLVLKLAPNFAQKSEVQFKLGVIFGKVYQLDYALKYFKMAVMDSGTSSITRRTEINIKMGICYMEKKNYNEALQYSGYC